MVRPPEQCRAKRVCSFEDSGKLIWDQSRFGTIITARSVLRPCATIFNRVLRPEILALIGGRL